MKNKKYLWILGLIGIVVIIAVPIGLALPKAEAARDNPQAQLPQYPQVPHTHPSHAGTSASLPYTVWRPRGGRSHSATLGPHCHAPCRSN